MNAVWSELLPGNTRRIHFNKRQKDGKCISLGNCTVHYCYDCVTCSAVVIGTVNVREIYERVAMWMKRPDSIHNRNHILCSCLACVHRRGLLPLLIFSVQTRQWFCFAHCHCSTSIVYDKQYDICNDQCQVLISTIVSHDNGCQVQVCIRWCEREAMVDIEKGNKNRLYRNRVCNWFLDNELLK